jgi:integrase
LALVLESPKVEQVTKGLEPYFRQLLLNIPDHNQDIICNFLQEEILQLNIKPQTIMSKLKVLCYVSRFLEHKSFKDMDRQDVVLYLSSLRKEGSTKWIGTHNGRVLVLHKFFTKIGRPEVMTSEENAIFLKFCPSKRDKAFYAMQLDTACRPHELLGLNVGDIKFMIENSSNRQYALISVNGKTGTRTLPLIHSLPYVKVWLATHPEAGNPKAPLFVSESDKSSTVSRLGVDGVWARFKKYHSKYFPQLLDRKDVAEEDKKVIRAMLQKPWNPYLYRHSALTQKSQQLSESNLRAYAGWSANSKMPSVYLHYLGNESSKALLEGAGILPKYRQQEVQQQLCPHCNEPNVPSSKFCMKCKLALSYDDVMTTTAEQNKLMERIKALEARFSWEVNPQ